MVYKKKDRKMKIVQLILGIMIGVLFTIVSLKSSAYTTYTDQPNITLEEYWEGK